MFAQFTAFLLPHSHSIGRVLVQVQVQRPALPDAQTPNHNLIKKLVLIVVIVVIELYSTSENIE